MAGCSQSRLGVGAQSISDRARIDVGNQVVEAGWDGPSACLYRPRLDMGPTRSRAGIEPRAVIESIQG